MALRTRNGGSQTPDYWLKLARNTQNYLLEHPDNPLFKLLRLFEVHTKNILNILSVKGVAFNLAITNAFMEEHKILDLLNLHEYIALYYNFSDFIKGEVK